MANDQRAVDIIKIYAIILNGDYCERQRNYSKKLNKYYRREKLLMNSILLWKNSECLKGNILCKKAFPIS